MDARTTNSSGAALRALPNGGQARRLGSRRSLPLDAGGARHAGPVDARTTSSGAGASYGGGGIAGDRGEQRRRRGLAELRVVDPDARERRRGERGERRVVEPGDRELARHGDPVLARGGEPGGGEQVAAVDDRGRPPLGRQQRGGRGLARLRVRDRPGLDAGGGERRPPDRQPRLHVLVVRGPADERRRAGARARAGARRRSSIPRACSVSTDGNGHGDTGWPATTTGSPAVGQQLEARDRRARRRRAGSRPRGRRRRAARRRRGRPARPRAARGRGRCAPACARCRPGSARRTDRPRAGRRAARAAARSRAPAPRSAPAPMALGRQPSSSAASRIRRRVDSATPGRSLTANDTAADETPARAATSSIVGRRARSGVHRIVSPRA